MSACSRPFCFAPDTTCILGHLDVGKCPSWQGQADGKIEKTDAPEGEVLLPWSGSALGRADLGFIGGRAKPMVIGIIGPENAGKTTLLAAWYLLLGRGARSKSQHGFAGSFSLLGWEAVANSLKWAPGNLPQFPPHTASRVGRAPGLLHLAFRHDERISDYVFTDAPGEWFGKWAVNRNSIEAQGAHWIAENADAFIFVADREALAGPSMGLARGAVQLLGQRLAAERRGRSVAFVWTKADVALSQDMEDTVRSAVLEVMPNAPWFSVTVKSTADDGSQGFLALLDWVLNVRRAVVPFPEPETLATDPLFLFGRR